MGLYPREPLVKETKKIDAPSQDTGSGEKCGKESKKSYGELWGKYAGNEMGSKDLS